MSGKTQVAVDSLVFFPPLPSDINKDPPARKSSLFDIFRKPKDKSTKDDVVKSDPASAERTAEAGRSTFYVSSETEEPHTKQQLLNPGVKGHPLGLQRRVKGRPEDLVESGSRLAAQKSAYGNVDDVDARKREEGGVEGWQYLGPPRSLSLVMKQISNLSKGQEQGGSASSVRRYWMPDSQCKECYECGEKFTTFKRRHHCRVCGQVFCHTCCKQVAVLNAVGLMEGERVCSYCNKVLRSYATSGDTSGDLRALQEDLRKVSVESTHDITPTEGRTQRAMSLLEVDLSDTNPFEVNGQSENSISDATSNDEWQLLLKDSPQLRDLWLLIQHPSNGIAPQTHRYRLRNYHDCIIGCELVDWLLKKDKATNREQATAIGQSLLEAKWLRAVPGQSDGTFRDDNLFYSLYKAEQVETSTVITDQGEIAPKEYPSEPNWFQEIPTSDQTGNSLIESGRLDAVRYDHVTQLDPRGFPEDELDSMSAEASEQIQSSRGGNGFPSLSGLQRVQDLPSSALPISPEEQEVCLAEGQDHSENNLKEQFRSSSLNHIKVLLMQILEKDGLDTAWFDIILKMAERICAEVEVDVQAKDLMDIRQYVHVKKLPGGSRQECEIIHGTVCTKNVTNKKMISDLSHPKILLLGAAVEHQRVENKFVSLEPVVLQEREFLKNCVSKLTAGKPDILVVERTVARVAQEFLLAHGITLVSNTKPLVLARIMRCTGASLEESIEQAAHATLGSCQRLHFKVYQLLGGYSKTLMFIDGCPPQLGCSVLLRGDSLLELRKVKRCLLFIVYALYHSGLEAAYLYDSFALPIRLGHELLSPSSEGYSSHAALGSSFFDGMARHEVHDKFGGSQDKSVTGTIKSAVQKLMKGQETKQRGKDNKEIIAGEEKEDTLAQQGGISVTQDKDMSGQSLNRVGMTLATAINVDRGVATAERGSESPVIGDGNIHNVDEEEKRTEETCKVKDEEECPVSPGSDVFEVESKIIPFTALLMTTGEPVTCGLSLATPVKLSPFQRALKEVKLSSSPHLVKDLPFLVTKRGLESASLKFLPDELFTTPKLVNQTEQPEEVSGEALDDNESVPEEGGSEGGVETWKLEIEKDYHFYHSLDRCTKPSREVRVTTPHPFLNSPHLPNGDHFLGLVADFRARGGRLVLRHPKRYRSAEIAQETSSSLNGVEDAHSGSQTLPSDFRDDRPHRPISEGEYSNAPIRDELVDCLDPYHHQRLSMQFSSFSLLSDNAPNYCIHPRMIQMEFYAKNDMTLGHFLDKFCFDTLYTCRSRNCEIVMLQHIRRFVHGESCLDVILRVLDQPVVEDVEDILVWNWCRRCLERLPYQTLSKDASQMSFSKYLELRFHARDYTSRVNVASCGHSLHRNHNQYFGRGRIVATFKYRTINVSEVVLPPPTLPSLKPFVMFPDHQEELSNINVKGTNLLLSICANITNLTNTIVGCPFLEDKRAEFSGMYEDHQMLFKKHLIGLKDKVEELESLEDENKEREVKELELQDSLVNARRALAQIGMAWDMRFEEFLYQEKERRRREQGRSKKLTEDDQEKLGSSSSIVKNESDVLSTPGYSSDMIPQQNVVSPSPNSPNFTPDISIEEGTQSPELVLMKKTAQTADTGAGETDTGLDLSDVQELSASLESGSPRNTLRCPSVSADNLSVSSATSSIDLSDCAIPAPTKSSGQNPPTQPTHRRKKTSMFQSWMSDKPAPVKLDMPFPPDQHYMLPPCDIASIVIFDKEPSSIIAYTLSSENYKESLRAIELNQCTLQSGNLSGRSSPTGIPTERSSDKESSKTKRKNPKKMFNLIWNKGSSSPLPAAGESDSTDNDGRVEKKPSGNPEASQDEADVGTSKLAKDAADNSIVCEFTDPAHSQFWCQVYYPSEFARLREVLFPSGEEVYIRSLSRCKCWKATGGKSGSKFSKTEDDRFILKEIQRTESDFFLQFAPHYMKHMENAVHNNQPTVLTKIFGFYTIVCKNPITDTATRQHIIVMENLFYERNISRIFDLKGSIRNRHVKTPSGSEEERHVLMDENLIKEMVKSPLYIRLHDKSILAHALDADTRLLARHFVMDYSLLVGIDRDENELVIGIIDFIRKFTFDKKLEMIVKSSGIVGGHGKTPTILSPELYRTRFCEAMDKYFVLVPDRWTGLGKDCYEP